jgi:hypothetical protein
MPLLRPQIEQVGGRQAEEPGSRSPPHSVPRRSGRKDASSWSKTVGEGARAPFRCPAMSCAVLLLM